MQFTVVLYELMLNIRMEENNSFKICTITKWKQLKNLHDNEENHNLR